MNMYSDNDIILSEESTDAFISSLFDKDNISRRDAFIADIEQNISFLEDGNCIVVDIPDTDYNNCESNIPVTTVVNTRKASINVNISITVNSSCHVDGMRSYSGILSDADNKYAIGIKTQKNEWTTITQELSNVA